MTDKIREYLRWKSSYAKTAGKVYEYPLNGLKLLNKRLSDLELEDVISYQINLKEKYAPATVAYNIAVLKDFIGFFYKKGETKVDPDYIRIPRYIANERSVSADGDMERLLEAWDKEKFFELRNRVILRILNDTGIRISELADLNLQNLKKQTAIIQTKKTTRQRLIMWSSETQNELNEYLGVRICLDYNTDAVFVTKVRTRITTRQIQRIIQQSRSTVGIERHLTAHSFRHGKAHNMIDRGANVKEIASVLGHSENNPTAAFKYLIQSQNELEKTLTKYL